MLHYSITLFLHLGIEKNTLSFSGVDERIQQQKLKNEILQ